MCMRKIILNVGAKIFNVFVILFFLATTTSAIMAGRAIGGKPGLMTAISQTLMSWGLLLVIALIVYSLLDIRCALMKDNDLNK